MKPGFVLVFLLLGAAPAAAQVAVIEKQSGASATPPDVPVTRLKVQPAAAPVPALKYKLLPELREQKPGNAMVLYYRAFSPEWNAQSRPEVRKLIDAWTEDMRRVPPKELRWVTTYAALKEIDRGARRSYCDWEMTDRLREDGIAMLLPDVQSFRQYASLLGMRARFEIADGHFDKAAATLQTGLAFGRHVSDAPTLVQALVGTAITNVMLTEVEEFIQAPGSPNLYWSLSQLPVPFIDLRKGYQGERIMIDNLFPGVRELLANPKARPGSERDARAMVDHLLYFRRNMGIASPGDWEARIGLAFLAARTYPAARAYLIGQGRTAAEVDAMPVLLAGLMYEVYNYDRFYDDFAKWHALPYWQARPGLEKTETLLKQAKAAGPGTGTTLATLMVPAVNKVQLASVRADRRIAALRCVEALRLYAAAHDGKLPDSLADVKEVPVPIDPVTGNPFVYSHEGDRAILTGPAPGKEPPAQNNFLRYELTVAP